MKEGFKKKSAIGHHHTHHPDGGEISELGKGEVELREEAGVHFEGFPHSLGRVLMERSTGGKT